MYQEQQRLDRYNRELEKVADGGRGVRYKGVEVTAESFTKKALVGLVAVAYDAQPMFDWRERLGETSDAR